MIRDFSSIHPSTAPHFPAAVAKKLSSIPDPTKDIGFNIMSRFHYSEEVKLRIYDNLAEAVKSLE